jgi:hypothetical protein
MKLFNYITFLLLISISAEAQIETIFVKSSALKAGRIIGIDNLESNFYINDNTLYKSQNEKNINYNNLQLGTISSANTFNSLKINVFYKSFNTVIILDNRLSEMFRIKFNSIQPFKDITHVSTGNDNTIWVFNQSTQQLENYDYKTNKTRVQTLPIQGEVLDLKSNYNFCWLLTKSHIYTYNYFGSLISKTANNGFTSIEENNGDLFLLKENTLFLIANGSDSIQKILLPNLLIKQFLVTNETLYIYDDEFLHQYQLKMN